MGTPIKVKHKKKKETPASRKPLPAKVSLPTEVSKPETELGGYTLLIYGEKKIGKTSLVANFPKTFCMMFEPGGKSLRIYQKPVHVWEDFLGYIELLENTKHPFKTVSIDTLSFCYDRCLEYVCRVNGMSHPSDEGYGKGWKKVADELRRSLTRLMYLDLGVIGICHNKYDEIKTRSGDEYRKIIPNLSGQAMGFFAATFDTIAHYHYIDDQRVLTLKGTDHVEAGTRCEENFFTTKGERIMNIDMGKNSKEAYKNLIDAFHNRLHVTGEEVVPKKKKLKKFKK